MPEVAQEEYRRGLTATQAYGLPLAKTALSFIGLSAPPQQPSWGGMLDQAQTPVLQAPMLDVYLGVAILLSVLRLSLLGDGLHDLMGPKLARWR